MKKYILLTVLCLIVSLTIKAQKQKITVDNDTIKVDGSAYGIIEKKNVLQSDYTVKTFKIDLRFFC